MDDEATIKLLVERGWRVRWVWKRSFDSNKLLARLRYLLSSDEWRIDLGSVLQRVRRFGPLYVDTLAPAREQARKAVEMYGCLLAFHATAEERGRELDLLRAQMRELRHSSPAMRTSERGAN